MRFYNKQYWYTSLKTKYHYYYYQEVCFHKRTQKWSFLANFFFKNSSAAQNFSYIRFFKKVCAFVLIQELEQAFKVFDRDQSGEVDYDEFLLKLRGDCLNPKREKVSYFLLSVISGKVSTCIAIEALHASIFWLH